MALKMRILSLSDTDSLSGGVHPPMSVELDTMNLPIEGEIPSGLNGILLRNGPSPLYYSESPGIPAGGPGMVHAMHLENGRARYRNRRVRTEELLSEMTTGRPNPGSSRGKHPANHQIISHAGQLLALGETGRPYRLDWDLNTVGTLDFQGVLSGGISPHPKTDPETGEMILVANEACECRLACLTLDAYGQPIRTISFDSPWPAAVHDIAVTRNYVVVIFCPLVLEVPEPRWRPAMGTAIALIPRRGTEQGIRWFETRPFYHLHVMNAFEKGNYIEIQLPWYSSSRITTLPVRAELHRIRINLDNRTVLDEQLDDCAIEFPRIDDRFAMRENRFGYAAFRNTRPGEQSAEGSFEALVRYDFHTASRTVHTLPPWEFVGEPVFAPAADARDEGEGYLMTFVYNASKDRSSFRIYDAQDLYAPPLAQIHLPHRVPTGCHSTWVPDRNAGSH